MLFRSANNFADFPRDLNMLIVLTMLSQVCVFLGDVARAQMLYDLLLPYSGRNVVTGPAVTASGSASLYLGTLAAALELWDEAEEHFQDALEMNEQMGARPFVAHTQYGYAQTLLTRDPPGDRQKALRLLTEALDTAQELATPPHRSRPPRSSS